VGNFALVGQSLPHARKTFRRIKYGEKGMQHRPSLKFSLPFRRKQELSKKQVGAVFDSLGASIKKSLRSHGLFTLPGLLKMKVVKKPATKAREGGQSVQRAKR